jgi:hypothetical protein
MAGRAHHTMWRRCLPVFLAVLLASVTGAHAAGPARTSTGGAGCATVAGAAPVASVSMPSAESAPSPAALGTDTATETATVVGGVVRALRPQWAAAAGVCRAPPARIA